MRRDGVQPNTVTYNTLMNLSPDFETAKAWLDQMRRDGVQPNTVTYNTLINLSPDFETAKVWLDQMRRDGVQSDEWTAISLTRWIRTFQDADLMTAQLTALGGILRQGYYSAVVVQLLPSIANAQDLLRWYTRQAYRNAVSLEPAIRHFTDTERRHEGLRISLAFPYLGLCRTRRLFRRHPHQAIAYYDDLLQRNFEPFNTTYAICAYAYMEAGLPERALPMFRSALDFATAEKRRSDIEARIVELENPSSSTEDKSR